MRNIFYVYQVGKKFVAINKKNLKPRLVKDIEFAAYWFNKKAALTWERSFKFKHPTVKLKEAKLIIKK